LKCEENVRSLLLNSDAIASQYKESKIEAAVEEDFYTEFLDLIIAVKSVSDVDAAVVHINEHGSKHTDCIVTENKDTADYFMTRVDAAGCYWNASTRFADGFRYGFGAEVGVSTNKTHARGPVGLEGLVIYKYKLFGNGECAAEYGSGKKQYKHETIEPAQYKL
jgi:glutamate-5-semialdehyde dehydrogenase